MTLLSTPELDSGSQINVKL